MRTPVRPRHFQTGFTLIETLVALGIGLVVTAAGAQFAMRHSDKLANQAAAQHLEAIANGAHAYAAANSDAILATLATSPAATVSVATLQAQGYVPAGLTPKNNYGQDYSIRFVSSGPGAFEGLLTTTGGEDIDSLNKRKIAQLVGASGGYVDDAAPAALEGSFGAWQRPLSDFGLAAGSAELSYALFMEQAIDNSAPTSGFMSRSMVAGQPELNRMGTSLDMNGNRVAGSGSAELANGAQRTYAGTDSAGRFTVGDGANTASSTKWFTAGSAGTVISSPLEVTGPLRINGFEAWHQGSFDPATKVAVVHEHDAGEIDSGVLDAARVPALDTLKITTGTVGAARVPGLDASKLVSGAVDAERIGGVDASKIVSGAFVSNQIPALDAATTTTGTFLPDRIPGLDASKVVSGSFVASQIPMLDASKIGSGILAAALVPELDASKLTTGTVDVNRIPVVDVGRIPDLDASKITTGVVGAGQIPDLDASKITTGTVGTARVPDLDAAKITTGVLNAARIPDIDAAKITTGVLGVARIPGLDASKITTGVFADAQIPLLSISKITGLQAALDSKLNTSTYTAADVLTKLKMVDGVGSGLEADVLDGLDSAFFRNASNFNAGTIPNAQLPSRLQEAAAWIGDWNQVLANGWYMAPGAANAPDASGAWFIGEVVQHNADWVTQTLYRFTDDHAGDSHAWRRSKNGGGWGAWYRLRLNEAEQRALWVDRNGSTMYGTLEIVNTYRSLAMKSGGHAHAYMEFYVNPSNQSQRSGFIGYGTPNNATMHIYNELAGGNIVFRPAVASGGYVYVDSRLHVQNGLNVNGEVYIHTGWLRVDGDRGLYFSSYYGGWNMIDTLWLRAYNNRNIYTAGEMRAGRVQSDGDMHAQGGTYIGSNLNTNTVQVRGVAACNTGCSPTGLVAIDASGNLMSCANGIWQGFACGSYSTGGGGPGGGGCACPPDHTWDGIGCKHNREPYYSVCY